MVQIPAGTIEMGDTTKPGTKKTVNIKSFWIGKMEVLWELFDIYAYRLDLSEAEKVKAADSESRPSKPYGAPDRGFGHQGYPALSMHFPAAQVFCDWLSKKTGKKYRLPTEAEWEYACRAGTTGPFSTGENLTTAQANYRGQMPYASFPAGEFRQRTTAVGAFPANPWGLSDMHGNVWEWTADWYGPYTEDPAANIDPQGPAQGTKRVIRGGSWFFDANSARCGLRYTHSPQDKGFSLGFRLAADRRR